MFYNYLSSEFDCHIFSTRVSVVRASSDSVLLAPGPNEQKPNSIHVDPEKRFLPNFRPEVSVCPPYTFIECVPCWPGIWDATFLRSEEQGADWKKSSRVRCNIRANEEMSREAATKTRQMRARLPVHRKWAEKKVDYRSSAGGGNDGETCFFPFLKYLLYRTKGMLLSTILICLGWKNDEVFSYFHQDFHIPVSGWMFCYPVSAEWKEVEYLEKSLPPLCGCFTLKVAFSDWRLRKTSENKVWREMIYWWNLILITNLFNCKSIHFVIKSCAVSNTDNVKTVWPGVYQEYKYRFQGGLTINSIELKVIV